MSHKEDTRRKWTWGSESQRRWQQYDLVLRMMHVPADHNCRYRIWNLLILIRSRKWHKHVPFYFLCLSAGAAPDDDDDDDDDRNDLQVNNEQLTAEKESNNEKSVFTF